MEEVSEINEGLKNGAPPSLPARKPKRLSLGIVTISNSPVQSAMRSMSKTTEAMKLNRNPATVAMDSSALTLKLMTTTKCSHCKRSFGIGEKSAGKRRHCRRCGEIFCTSCCSEKTYLAVYHSPSWGVLKNHTSKLMYVCKPCMLEVSGPSAVTQALPLPPPHSSSSPVIHGRGRAGSLLINRVTRARKNTLEKYMEVVKEQEVGNVSAESTPRFDHLDEGFKQRLLAKNSHQPAEKSLHRAKTLRDGFFDGVSPSPLPFPAAAPVEPLVQEILHLDSKREMEQAAKMTQMKPNNNRQSWGGFFMSTLLGPISVMTAAGSNDSEMDEAFELQENEFEHALQEQTSALRSKLHQQEEEKMRMLQVKQMCNQLEEVQQAKISSFQRKSQFLEKQLRAHAKQLETLIREGTFFGEDDAKGGVSVDLRDELRDIFLHLDGLQVESVFPTCMRWKLKTKVEDGLFVGVRDLDLAKFDANFAIQAKDGVLEFSMSAIQLDVALYGFDIQGFSAKAKMLRSMLASSLNRVEISIVGEWKLPLRFEEGGTKSGQTAYSRWVPDRPVFTMNLVKTSEKKTAFQLPDSLLQWFASSLIPSTIESMLLGALPTKELGKFLSREASNTFHMKGRFEIHGDTTPAIWKAPLVGPTSASALARKCLGLNEDEAFILDFILRSNISKQGAEFINITSLANLHTWRLRYAAHPLASFAPLFALLEQSSRLKIPRNWTLQLFRRLDELAAKPMNIAIHFNSLKLDWDVKDMLTMITSVYIHHVEDNVAKELELEAARKQRQCHQGNLFYQSASDPALALKLADQAVTRIHHSFDVVWIPLLRDECRTEFNCMIAGGSGGLFAFSFTNVIADVCLPDKFHFSYLMYQSLEIYEGFVLRVNGQTGPIGSGEYTLKFNVLPVGDEVDEDTPVEEEANDAETTLKNVKMDLFPAGKPLGTIHIGMDAWKSSIMLSSLIKMILASAATPTPPTNTDLQHDALKEESRVRRNTVAHTNETRELLLQSRKVVENMWGSFRAFQSDFEGSSTAQAEIAGLDPLQMTDNTNKLLNTLGSTAEQEENTQKLLMPYLMDDAFALHLDVRGLELKLCRVVSTSTTTPSSTCMRLILQESSAVEASHHHHPCVSFSLRRNLQDVLQTEMLPI